MRYKIIKKRNLITENNKMRTVKIINEYFSEKECKCEPNDAWRYVEHTIDLYGMIGLEYFQKATQAQNKLYEGLICSYDYKVLCRKLEEIGVIILKVNMNNKTPVIFASIPAEINKKYYELLNVCGWYESDKESMFHVIVPRFGANADNVVYDNNNGKLYHITPIKNAKKILKQGLVPKHGCKIDVSQDLIHFFLTKNECVSLAPSLRVTDKTYNSSNTYTLFEIDLSKLLKCGTKPKFFYDPKYPNAIVTKDNIPPFCLTRIADYEINM